MPSSDQSKTQPVANPQTPSEACGAVNLEQEIAALAVRMATVGQARQSHKDAGGTSHAEAPAGADEPWDAEQAEALTRIYEMAEAELEATRQHPRTPAPKRQARGKRAAAAGQQAQAPESDRVWLEARFAGIAALLQQSLADSNPAESFADLAQRLDQLEARLDSLRSDMSARLGGDWLQLIDEHVKELSAQFEAASRQLTRLDAIDEQLRQLSRALEEHRQGSQAQPAGLRDDAIEALTETTAERAASRLAASMPAPEVDGNTRIGALEGMMQDYIAERRRGEEVTSGILHTIEEALIRIIDRIDAMEAPALYAGADATTPGSDGMEAEGERLAEAYASGARVLGQKGAEPALDAADYVPSAPRQEAAAREMAGPGTKDAAASEETQTRHELRASALRGKLRAQAAPEVPTLAIPEPDDATAGAAALGHAQTPTQTPAKTLARASGARSRLLMGGAMALLFGAGYIGVDLFLAPGPSAGVPQSSAAPATSLAQPESQTDKLAPRTNDRKTGAVPVPQPAKRRTPEPAAGDVTQSQTAEPPTPHLAGLQVPEAARAAASGAEPTAISPEALAGAGLQDGQLAGNDGATPSGVDVMLPEAVGTAALRSAAAKGDVFAQFEVATRFAEGTGVAQDQKQAFAWYERAATRGLASAQFRLGGYYERGVGVDADAERAKIWYRRAAEQGHVRAMHNLAVLIVGRGKEHADYAAAVHWFQEAATRGYIDSQFNLATLYAHGRGVAKDLTESYKWFALAARAGDSGAARRLEEIKGQLELSEQEAAEKKLAAWRPQAVEPTSVSHAGR